MFLTLDIIQRRYKKIDLSFLLTYMCAKNSTIKRNLLGKTKLLQ